MSVDMVALKNIALRRFKKKVETEEDLIEFLKLWWSNKYQLPDNHSLFLERTLEEHVLDYYLDKFSSNPEEVNKPTAEEIEESDKKLKEEYGDGFEDAYYMPPPGEDSPQDVDEKF